MSKRKNIRYVSYIKWMPHYTCSSCLWTLYEHMIYFAFRRVDYSDYLESAKYTIRSN